MADVLNRAIYIRKGWDPLWNEKLQEGNIYPSIPYPIPLGTIAPQGIGSYRWRDLPSRYHWFIWLEHAGNQIGYVYDSIQSSIMHSPDTTIEQLVDMSGYDPLDFEPLHTGWDLDFRDFLASTIKKEYRMHFPFLAKYGIKNEEDHSHEFPVAYKFRDRALSMILNMQNIEQDLWHIFCIIYDTHSLRDGSCQ